MDILPCNVLSLVMDHHLQTHHQTHLDVHVAAAGLELPDWHHPCNSLQGYNARTEDEDSSEFLMLKLRTYRNCRKGDD